MNRIKQILLIIAIAPCVTVQASEKAERASNLPWGVALGCAALAGAGCAGYYAYHWYYDHRYWTVNNVTKEVNIFLKEKYPHRNANFAWNGKAELDADKISLHNVNMPRDKFGMQIYLSYSGGKWHAKDAIFHRVSDATESQETSSILVGDI